MDITYIVTPLILISVVLAAVWLDRWRVPIILVALGGGILFGSDVLNLWYFDNAFVANKLANLALVFILFQGGFGIKRQDFMAVALPAGGLAVWGVVLTATVTFAVLWKILGWSLAESCLIAAVISSTDAAATLSILRRYALPKRLSSTLVTESAANDPMAILLTVVTVQALTAGEPHGLRMVMSFAWKFSAGPVVGWLMARLTVLLFNKLRAPERGHYYVLFVAALLFTYGSAEGLHASGMLAVFIAGCVMGNHPFVHKQGIAQFSSAFASIANIGVFVLLGLLVFPHQWGSIWMGGVALFLVLTFVSRPLAVAVGTLGMGIPAKNKAFLVWAGLRGAVPIVLATYPAAAGVPGSQDIFNLVFFAVILSVLIQGSTLGAVARALGLLSRPSRSDPPYSLELITMAPSDMDLVAVDIPEDATATGPRIRDLRLPPDSVITMITRGDKVISPNGDTQLRAGDHITVLAHVRDEEAVQAALLTCFLSAAAEEPDRAKRTSKTSADIRRPASDQLTEEENRP
jgi:cell volume regulation protein A